MTDPTAWDSEFLFDIARIKAPLHFNEEEIARLRTIARKLQRLEMFLDDMKPVRVRDRSKTGKAEVLGSQL